MQARPVYIKFSQTHRKTLLRRLWAANSLDLLLDFGLTYVSVVFNYLGPFFLKKILDSLEKGLRSDREKVYQAYIYAFLAFLSTLCKVCRTNKMKQPHFEQSLGGSRRTASVVWPTSRNTYSFRAYVRDLRQSPETKRLFWYC